MLENLNNYGPFVEYAQNGNMILDVREITKNTWRDYFVGVLNILKDGIETEFVHKNFVSLKFQDTLPMARISIVDLFYNLIMWQALTASDRPIQPKNLLMEDCVTQSTIKEYIDNIFIKSCRKNLDNKTLNNSIDDILEEFVNIDDFSFYFANTINLEDDIALMNASPEYYGILHDNIDNISLEEVNNYSMSRTNEGIKLILDSDKLMGYEHCLTDSWRAQQGVNSKQYKEYSNIIGTKPDGQGGVYPYAIGTSFINGGLTTLAAQVIESSTGRTAQIMAKNNVGDSGRLARVLGLNNQDTYLNPDPNYCCDSHNFMKLYVKNEKFFYMLCITGRYFRFHPNGEEFRLIPEMKYDVIEKTIYLRSPVTCASHAKGNGICYRCYGDLAYTNHDISVGKYAAEDLSEKFTQKMLSAKHLLESRIKQMRWNDNFLEYFEVDANLILLDSENNFTGWEIIIDPDDIALENEDDFKQGEDDSYTENIYNEYVTKFYLRQKSNKQHLIEICTTSYDKMYISKELNTFIRGNAVPIDGKICISITEKLQDSALFIIAINNNELSETMNKIINIIDKNDVTSSFDKDGFLYNFLDTICDGNIDIDSTHCEVIISNQIRMFGNKDDIDTCLDMPNWSNIDEPYRILTLNQALNYNPSVTVRMNYENLPKALYNPLTFAMHKPSFMDLFFMPKPQEFLNSDNEIVPTTKSTIEKNFEFPVTVIQQDDIQD